MVEQIGRTGARFQTSLIRNRQPARFSGSNPPIPPLHLIVRNLFPEIRLEIWRHRRRRRLVLIAAVPGVDGITGPLDGEGEVVKMLRLRWEKERLA